MVSLGWMNTLVAFGWCGNGPEHLKNPHVTGTRIRFDVRCGLFSP